MTRIFNFFIFCSLAYALPFAVAAQKKDRVEVTPKISLETIIKDCKDLKLGEAVVFPKPDYPPEAKAARIGGTVQITIKFDENGNFAEIEKIEGHKLLHDAAISAARKVKFKPTTCGGVAAKVLIVLAYNFIPFVFNESYFTPTKIEDFTDVTNDSPFFEAILNLTENYKLTFGYADKKFHADAPLTRGDFAHSLRLTLDLLSERAAAANKLPREIRLFYPHNPQKLTVVGEIKDLKKNEPFADSVKILLLKYDIAPVNEKREFQGKLPLTNNETIDLWTKIFGDDAIPINFEKINGGDRIISRGEFTLFLQESLQVLTYKVLP